MFKNIKYTLKKKMLLSEREKPIYTHNKIILTITKYFQFINQNIFFVFTKFKSAVKPAVFDALSYAVPAERVVSLVANWFD